MEQFLSLPSQCLERPEIILTFILQFVPFTISYSRYVTSNSCIMYPSDLPDMYTHTRTPPQAQGRGCTVHIRQITRARDTTDMYHDCRLIARGGQLSTNHPSQYKSNHLIDYIDVPTNFIMVSNVRATFVNERTSPRVITEEFS